MEPGKQRSRNEAAPGSRRQLSELLLAPSSGFPEACLHVASCGRDPYIKPPHFLREAVWQATSNGAQKQPCLRTWALISQK